MGKIVENSENSEKQISAKKKKKIYYQTGLLQKQKGTEKGLTMSFGNVFW